MSGPSDLERRFADLVERHIRLGEIPDISECVRDQPDLAPAMRQLFDDYLDVSAALDASAGSSDPLPALDWPEIPGFRTIERLGAGGMGEVYKLEDLTLHRVVAAKIIRADQRAQPALTSFLREARSLALFTDPRIVRILEFRDDLDPPVIIMEYVDGFELGRIGPSLEFPQRARLVRDVCEAIQRAHDLGIQHRDLKPSNIIVDGSLLPKVLDFGLSHGDPQRGHLRGTLHYLAPEQFDPSRPIDARTDVYALGVILFELTCGALPYDAPDTAAVIDAIRRAESRLPVELEPRVPEPLQAIALKAMERRPEDRYPSAKDMAADLARYLDGRPVLARPTQYAATLGVRVRPHVAHVEEWLRLRLIHSHEAERLQAAYRALDAREEDWIASSRSLSYSQIALYFGALLLSAGSLFYFAAHRFFHAVSGVARPAAVLATPFLGLTAVGWHLYRTERKAVAVAFLLAGIILLPLFLLIWFHETGLWLAAAGAPGQLFSDGSVSNRQLQVTVLVATTWAAWLATRTRTIALSTVFTVLAFVFALSLLADLGLRAWIDEQRLDLLALHLWPIAFVYGAAAAVLERSGRPWFARPMYLAAALTAVAVLDLLALDGRTFHYLGLSTRGLQPSTVSDPLLLDTVGALTLNGVAFYLLASLIERRGQDVMQIAAVVLFVIAPFSTLEPLAYLVENGQYSLRFDWCYLGLGAITALVSHQRQRRSFYYAGLLNTALALFVIADHRGWFDDAFWGVSLVVTGLVVLGAGYLLDAHERRRVP